MEKKYIYNKLNVFFGYGPLLGGFLVMGTIICLTEGIPKSKETWVIDGLLYLLILVPCLFIISWMVIVLKITIITNENGITYNSPFRKINLQWVDILKIERKYFYSGTFPMAGPPRDLEIRTKTNQKIKVFYFIVNSETLDFEEGLTDFESEIKKHINFEF
jgi:hypothetical protein